MLRAPEWHQSLGQINNGRIRRFLGLIGVVRCRSFDYFGHDSAVTTGNPTPKSVDPREDAIRRPCITANFGQDSRFDPDMGGPIRIALADVAKRRTG